MTKTELHKMSYLQLLILIDYDDMPKRVKCKDVIYHWNNEYRLYESEGDGMDLSRTLVEKYNDSELASDMSVIEGIEW